MFHNNVFYVCNSLLVTKVNMYYFSSLRDGETPLAIVEEIATTPSHTHRVVMT